MSWHKKDHFLPSSRDASIKQSIAQMLRQDHSGSSSAIKAISRQTDASPRAIKNWYSGDSSPNLSHFIRLSRMSPSITRWFLESAGYQGLADQLSNIRYVRTGQTDESQFRLYGITFDTKQIPGLLAVIQYFNHRQLWFYCEVYKGRSTRAEDMAKFWGVGIATAKRDIAGLIKAGMVIYEGSKRKGRYKICT